MCIYYVYMNNRIKCFDMRMQGFFYIYYYI